LLDIPTKLPSHIPKFENNIQEDPKNTFSSFHMWYSSNSFIEDNICLRRFQHMLTGATAQSYVDQQHASNSTFVILPKYFLSYF